MEKSISVSTPMVVHALTGARVAGVDIDRLLHKVGISTTQLEKTDERLPVERVVMLLRHCQGMMNDELFGLMEKPVCLGTLRFMALSSVHAKSQKEAMERCADYLNLFENSFYYRLDKRGSQTELRLEPIPGQSATDPYAVDFMLTFLHRFICWLGNRWIPINQVNISFPPPAYVDEYNYIYHSAPVLFNQSRNNLSFDRRYLERPVVQNETTVENYIRRAPMDTYLPVAAGGTMTESVRNLAHELFTTKQSMPELSDLTKLLEVNPHTLRRRLKTEGSSFHSIKAQLRRDIAIQHLSGEQYSIEEISALAGYSEPSAFIRAFRSWTGFTPLQFKKGIEI
jgi:AraC-like DNA-binding protein